MSESNGGEIISARCDNSPSFIASNIIEGTVLVPGEYRVLIDPIFTYDTPNGEYKKVIVDVYCSQNIHITPSEDNGFECFA